MPKWNTDQIVQAIESNEGCKPYIKNVDTASQGGDVDTENIIVYIKDSDNRLFICGFDGYEQSIINNPSDVDVPQVQVTDGCGSDEHISLYDDLNLMLTYAHITNLLRRMGFHISMIDKWW